MRHSAAAVISDKRPLGRILLLRVLEIRSSAGEKKLIWFSLSFLIAVDVLPASFHCFFARLYSYGYTALADMFFVISLPHFIWPLHSVFAFFLKTVQGDNENVTFTWITVTTELWYWNMFLLFIINHGWNNKITVTTGYIFGYHTYIYKFSAF